MHTVIFEAIPHPDRWDDYLNIAAALFSELEQVDGFISVERFSSLTNEGKVLSLSFWRDEDAVRRWREHTQHRGAQRIGRSEIFADYRLRIATIDRDYGKYARAQAPAHETCKTESIYQYGKEISNGT